MIYDHSLGAYKRAGTMVQKIREWYYWKLKYFSYMSIKEAEEIAHSWILMELNSVEEKNIWQS